MFEIGTKRGKWTIGKPIRKNGRPYHLCTCECGREVEVSTYSLRSGKSTRCRRCIGTHGRTKTPEYRVLSGMKSRCRNKNDSRYENYGARGIKVCERWNSFENFFADMGPRPSPKHSIERRDVNGDYEPANCEWATMVVQNRNKRATTYIEYKGESMLITDWSRKFGLSVGCLASRLRHGWTLEEAFNTPSGTIPYEEFAIGEKVGQWEILGPSYYDPNRRENYYPCWSSVSARIQDVGRQTLRNINKRGGYNKARKWTYKGESLTIRQWAVKTGIPRDRLKERVAAGWSIEKALETPGRNRTITYQGKTMGVNDWARWLSAKLGIRLQTAISRLGKWPIEQAISQEPRYRKPNSAGIKT